MIVIILILLVVIAVLYRSHQSPQMRTINVEVDPSVSIGTSRLHPGFTYTRNGVDRGNDTGAVANVEALLSGERRFQNQHIMGWGALNPEPSPGVYKWKSLDARINFIRDTGGRPVITLCCAPDWMKGGKPGETDWSKIEEAPSREHYADFAELARQVALRYPDVRHYQVWNELKGFFNSKLNRWDYASYTELYNLVYDTLKSVNPDLQIGGPYVVIDSWSSDDATNFPSELRGPWGVVDQRSLDVIEYWLRHKNGADFFTIDMRLTTKDRDLVSDEFIAAQKYSVVADWVRQRADLPLWWAEYSLPQRARNWDLKRQSAVLATVLTEMARSGTDVALLWQPEAEGSACVGCLWTDTRVAGGGQPTPVLESMWLLASSFGPGTPLVWSKASSAQVTVLSTPTQTLLVNHLPEQIRVTIDGERAFALSPYQIRVVDHPPTQ